MEIIPEYIEKLDEDTVRSLWRETETGIMYRLDEEGLFVNLLRIDLEMELLSEITTQAWEDAES